MGKSICLKYYYRQGPVGVNPDLQLPIFAIRLRVQITPSIIRKPRAFKQLSFSLWKINSGKRGNFFFSTIKIFIFQSENENCSKVLGFCGKVMTPPKWT